MSRGTTPPGARDEREAAAWVRGAFAQVAGRYDLLNHLLSGQVDRYWRWRTVRRLRPIVERSGSRVVDLCCGTGDLMLALQRRHAGTVWGGDFCHPMLTEATRKIAASGARSRVFEADALTLPLADASVDLITAAFGFRNFANYQAGLAEIHRVLRPGGTLAILEFSQPPNALFRALYNFYSRRVLPWIGGLISGSREAYTYLPESVRKFPGAEGLAEDMRRAGFVNVDFQRMTFGIVALHTAQRGGSGGATEPPSPA